MSRRRVTSHQVNTDVNTSFAVAFQKLAGVGDGKIITDLGDATIRLEGQRRRVVEPREGVYSFSIEVGERGTLSVMDIEFNVQKLPFYGESDNPNIPENTITFWDYTLLPVTEFRGVQQRLYLLGYLPNFSKEMNADTEIALLNFQADNGSIVINGEINTETTNALDTYFNDNSTDCPIEIKNPDGEIMPLIRRQLIKIDRAVSGRAQPHAPHPDTRGTLPVKNDAGEEITSGKAIISYVAGTEDDSDLKFKVKPFGSHVFDDNIYPVVASGTSVEVKERRVDDEGLVELTRQNSVDGDSVIELHYESSDGPVIGEVDVNIHGKKTISITVYMVTIVPRRRNEEERDSNSPFNSNALNAKWNRSLAEEVIDKVNEICATSGIAFSITFEYIDFEGRIEGILSRKNYSFPPQSELDGMTLEQLEEVIAECNSNYDETEELRSNNNSVDGIRVFLVDEYLEFGENGEIDRSTAGLAWKTQNATIIEHNDKSVDQLAHTTAHELGHLLSLTENGGSHSDEWPKGTFFRHDIWSRSRLMGYKTGYNVDNPDRSWQDTGYGKTINVINTGTLLTSKKLDNTDGEVSLSRKKAGDLIEN